MRGLMRRGAVLAGAVAVLLVSGMGIAAASPARPSSGAPAWSIMTTPNPPGGAVLHGVSCASAAACTATGNTFGSPVTVAERWNGTAWSLQSIPTISGQYVALTGVSCPSASACTAVGYYSKSEGTELTLAEHWNGTAWAIQLTPNPGGSSGTGVLNGVSCTAASACIAAGSGTGGTLAERYGLSS